MISTKEILSKYKSIALIGASKDLKKTSTVVMKYLQEYGFKVYPFSQGQLFTQLYCRCSEVLVYSFCSELLDLVNSGVLKQKEPTFTNEKCSKTFI